MQTGRPSASSVFQVWAESDDSRALAYVDPQGIIRFWNSAGERITGYAAEEALGARWNELFPFELYSTDMPVSLNNRSGAALTLRLCIHPLEDQGWAVSLRSLHDAPSLESLHQATRDALVVSEERFQFALEGANDGIWDWNLVTNAVFFSARWKTMLGYEPAELAGHVDTWRRLVHPEDLPRAEEQVSLYLSGQIDRYEVEFRMLHKQGGHRNILARGHRVLDPEGRPVRLVGTHVDITERKQAEEALRRSQELLQRTQALANVAGWTYQIESKLLLTSERGEHLLDRQAGCSEQDLKNVHPDDLPRLQAAWRAALLGQDLELEYRLSKPSGECWVFVRATVDRDSEGRPIRIIGAVQDITDQKKLQEQIFRAQKMEAVGQLAGGLAHDYNNIITIINASAEYILSQSPEMPYQEELNAIVQAGDQAASLTKQLLAFSRKQLLKPQALNLNQVVEHFQRMLARVIREDISFITDPQMDLSLIRADLGQIEQVLLNLVINARDAMDKGGTLTISTRNLRVDGPSSYACPVGDYVEMSVADTGTGMSQEVMESIFQPFFTTKEVGRGSGLGLSTVYGIVHQSGGFLQVQSQPGQGSTFSVIFPAICEAEDSRREPGGPLAQRKGTGTILLVEDESGVRRITRKLLESGGYRVHEAANAHAALELATVSLESIELLLTDVIMPGQLNGADLALELRKSRPGLKVLFMSGYAGEALSRNGVMTEGDCLLSKPFSPSILLEKVGIALGRGPVGGTQ
jgi:two-component system cell cycle sensor histidine kinase/response regulator CckA